VKNAVNQEDPEHFYRLQNVSLSCRLVPLLFLVDLTARILLEDTFQKPAPMPPAGSVSDSGQYLELFFEGWGALRTFWEFSQMNEHCQRHIWPQIWQRCQRLRLVNLKLETCVPSNFKKEERIKGTKMKQIQSKPLKIKTACCRRAEFSQRLQLSVHKSCSVRTFCLVVQAHI
jgi:hypothetical protein